MQHKIAIAGSGGMGSWHGELIERAENLTVAGVYDIQNSRMEYAKSGGFQTYTDFEEMLADSEAEIVLVATPNNLHKSMAIKALQAGKHVISEKPVTLNSQELMEIMKVSRETGMFFTVHQNRRWDEDYLTIKKSIKMVCWEKYTG